MKLLEYEAKQLLALDDLTIPKHTIVNKNFNSDLLSVPVVIKSQVPIGGRGKLGGVIIINSLEKRKETIEQLFALPIKGYFPNTLLAEEKLSIKHEHYLSLFV